MFDDNHQLFGSNYSANLDLNSPSLSNIIAPSISPEDLDYSFEAIKARSSLGRGSFGEVKRALYIPKNIHVAVKFQDDKEFVLEVKQLERLEHENIVKLYGIILKESGNNGIVMELMEGGSLHTILKKNNETTYTLSHAIYWCLQCARGLDYLHSMKPKPVIHRDIKPLNLLLDHDGLRLKICDFGTTCDVHTIMTTQRGTFVYMAPEVFKGDKYTEKCDVYSFAVTLWQCLSRQEPFKMFDNVFALMYAKVQGLKLSRIKNCPTIIQDLLDQCIVYDGKAVERTLRQRYSIAEVLPIMEKIFENCPKPVKPLVIHNFEPMKLPYNLMKNNDQRRISDGSGPSQPWKPGHSKSRSSGTIVPPPLDTQNTGETFNYLSTNREQVDDILKDFHAYMLLDEKYRPAQPDIHSQESMQLFEQHRRESVNVLRNFLEYKSLKTYYDELKELKKDEKRDDMRIYMEKIDENRSLKEIHSNYMSQLARTIRPGSSASAAAASVAAGPSNPQADGPTREGDFVFVRHQDATP